MYNGPGGATSPYRVWFEGSSGFRDEYKDPDPGNPQSHHFWFYVQATYETKRWTVGFAGNAVHEIRDPGRSIQDYRLGLKGIDLGWALAMNKMDYPYTGFGPRSVRDVATWLQDNVLR